MKNYLSNNLFFLLNFIANVQTPKDFCENQGNNLQQCIMNNLSFYVLSLSKFKVGIDFKMIFFLSHHFSE